MNKSLELFYGKVAFLKEWCNQYEHKYDKRPSVRIVFDAKLPGFKSKSEVERIMKYIKDEKA